MDEDQIRDIARDALKETLTDANVASMQADFLRDQRENAAMGMAPIPLPPAVKLSSNKPECDSCGAKGARSRCSGCNCVWYCNKSCQRYAWKTQGHKNACKTMREECDRKASELISFLPSGKDFQCLNELDCEGTYVRAVDKGLFSVFTQLMKGDVERCESWGKRDEPPHTAAHFILTTAFRGERKSRQGTGGFSTMDASRVAAYIQSSSDAYETLLAMLEATIRAVFRPGVYRHSRQMAAYSFRIARDVITAINMIFYKPAVPEVIFDSPWTKEAAERAEATARTLKRILRAIYAGERTGADQNGTLEANTNQLCGLLAYWVAERGGKEHEKTFEQILGFRGQKLAMYEIFGKKLAAASVAKGKAISMAEMQQLMR